MEVKARVCNGGGGAVDTTFCMVELGELYFCEFILFPDELGESTQNLGVCGVFSGYLGCTGKFPSHVHPLSRKGE